MRAFVLMAMLAVSAALPQITYPEIAELSIYTGSFYTTGTYGGDSTLEDLYFPISINYTGNRFGYRVTIPYLTFNAPVTVIDETDPTIENTTTIVQEEGLGDILTSFTIYNVINNDNYDFAVDITGKIKFATANYDQGLGSGENDYEIQTEFYKFFQRSTLFYSAGYRIRGDPDNIDLENVWLHNAGFTYRFSPTVKVGIIYVYRQSSIDYLDAIEDVAGFIALNINKTWQLQLHGISGVSETAADWGAGILLKKTFK